MRGGKVLMLTDELRLGGLERMVFNLSLELKRGGRWQPLLQYFATPGARTFEPELARAGFTLCPMPAKTGLSLTCSLRALALAHLHGATVVHAHDLGPLLYGAVAKFLSGGRLKLVHTRHGSVASSHWKYPYYDRLFLRFADEICVVSDRLKRELVASGVPEGKVTVLPNGIPFRDRPITAAARADARLTLAGEADPEIADDMRGSLSDRWILCLGRVCRSKGQHEVLGIWNALPAAVRERSRLFFVGLGRSASEVRELEAAMRDAANSERVRYLGVSARPDLWLAAAHVFVSGSVSEGMPLAPMEAIGAGVPCLLSDIDGHRLVGDGAAFFPLGDPARGARRLVRILGAADRGGDEWYLRRWKRAAGYRAAHGIELMARRYSRLYSRLDGGAR
jgi:glycosyltransferase involved in cell wall biosynthesis